MRMKLMTEELKEKFKQFPLRSQDGKGMDAEVVVKYFNPISAGTWLIIEGEELENGDWELFGYCHISDWAWESILLSELQRIELPFEMGIERDLYIDEHATVRSLMG